MILAGDEGPLRAPVSGRPCVWVRTVVSSGGKNSTLLDTTDHRPFLVDDGSGETAEVQPAGANVVLDPDIVIAKGADPGIFAIPTGTPEHAELLALLNVHEGGGFTCVQRVLAVGDRLYAIGPSRRDATSVVRDGFRSVPGRRLVLAAGLPELLLTNKSERALLSRISTVVVLWCVVIAAGLLLALNGFGLPAAWRFGSTFRGGKADVAILAQASRPTSFALDDTSLYGTNAGTATRVTIPRDRASPFH